MEDDSNVQPYQFEPIVDLCAPQHSANEVQTYYSSEGSESDSEEEVNEERRGNTDWCLCGEYEQMTTGLESMCCRDNADIIHKSDDEGVICITLHMGFIANCLNREVLKVALLDFVEADGPLDDNEPIHETYRYISYRRFARFIWQKLGKRNRKVLPACVVTKIRAAFPSEQYAGFKYYRA